MATAPTKQETESVPQGRPLTITEVHNLIEAERTARAEAGVELTYEQKLANDHAGLFARLPEEQSRELVAKLVAIGGKVTEYNAYKIADLLPTHADDVRAIFARDRVTPEKEEIEKIIDAVKGYL